MTRSTPQQWIWGIEMNRQVLASQEEYELAVRELSILFDNPPQPGTPEGDRFEALIVMVDQYETTHFPIA